MNKKVRSKDWIAGAISSSIADSVDKYLKDTPDLLPQIFTHRKLVNKYRFRMKNPELYTSIPPVNTCHNICLQCEKDLAEYFPDCTVSVMWENFKTYVMFTCTFKLKNNGTVKLTQKDIEALLGYKIEIVEETE